MFYLPRVRQSFTTKSNMADELPSVSLIATSVDLNLSLAQIGGNAAAGNQNGTLWVLAKGTRKLIELRLVSQTPVVLSVLDLGNLLPSLSAVGALHNGEPNIGRFRGIVLPSAQKGTIRQLKRTSVENLRVSVVGRRIKDLNITEGLSLW